MAIIREEQAKDDAERVEAVKDALTALRLRGLDAAALRLARAFGLDEP